MKVRTVRRNFSDKSTNSFDNVTTKIASNGCLIIEEALAYLECTIHSYLPSGDCEASRRHRTLIYAAVENGEVFRK